MNKNRLFIMIAVILFVVLAVLIVLAVKLNVENQPLPPDEQETEAAVETDPTEENPAQENSAEPTEEAGTEVTETPTEAETEPDWGEELDTSDSDVKKDPSDSDTKEEPSGSEETEEQDPTTQVTEEPTSPIPGGAGGRWETEFDY